MDTINHPVRAAVLYGREDVRIETIHLPALGPGEVRVEIQAALTCGTDLKVFKRGYHARMIVPPAVFGHEFAGVISEVGPGAEGWTAGDRVVAGNSAPCGACFYCRHDQENLCDDLIFLNGAYAQSIVVPARLVSKNLLRLKPETSFVDAALTEPLACVVQGVGECDFRVGQTVLVIGAGPIGLMFTALARHAGTRVIVAGRGAARLEKALSLGATLALDVSGVEALGAHPALVNAGPFDVVVEAVGKPETWEASVRLVRKGGKVNFFGGCPSGAAIALDTALIHYSNLHLLASFHHTPRTIRRALDLIESGIVRADDFVTGARPLVELPELLRTMAAGNRNVKTLIDVR